MKRPSEENRPQPEQLSGETQEGAALPEDGNKWDVEEVHLTGEKTPVVRDEKTTKDEYTDYKFLKSRRTRSHNYYGSAPTPRIQYTSTEPEVSAEPAKPVPAAEPVKEPVKPAKKAPAAAQKKPVKKAPAAEQEQLVKKVPVTVEPSEKAQPSVKAEASEPAETISAAVTAEPTPAVEETELVQSSKSSSTEHHHHHHHHHSSSSSDGKSHHHHHHHHHRHHRRRKMKKWKKVLLIVISSILALCLVISAVAIVLINYGKWELFDSELKVIVPEKVTAEVQDDGDYIVYKGHTYKYNKDITNLLFLGIDKESFDDENDEGTGGQADVVVMMALNMKNHKLTMLAVPRDTITEVALYSPSGHYSGMKNMQVCMAYAYGDGKESSCENMVSSVRRIFYNVPIKTYYALDLEGIAAVNDSVGGVDVVSPETIFTFVEGESYHLEGRDAEHFVRMRDKSRVDSSLLRLERQKEYARGFMKTMMGSIKEDVTSAVRVFNESAPYSCTNLSVSKVSYLASQLVTGDSMETEMQTVPGKITYENDLARYDIDEDQFFEQFLSVYYEKVN